MTLRIALTGATGYIGSHIWAHLLELGVAVAGVDNFSNSSRAVLDSLRLISGSQLYFTEMDIRDTAKLQCFLQEFSPDVVVHLAALKSVSESISSPLDYYNCNIAGLLSLVQAMELAGCTKLVFSSSASVYGAATQLPITETSPTFPTNPYARTKLIGEQILADLAAAQIGWSIIALRYFNPIGAHSSGMIGDSPLGPPSNLLPTVANAAAGILASVKVYGDDYPTVDGTGVRDYIHVMDLARGHLAAARWLMQNRGFETINLGTGRGHSVLEVIRAYERVSGKSIPFEIVPRRPGDVAECYASVERAKSVLLWAATEGIEAMCRDSWSFQCRQGKSVQAS
jgi:UDP-glucose 4-epimerase